MTELGKGYTSRNGFLEKFWDSQKSDGDGFVKTLIWDFFGPHSEPTAKHFQKHLNEFLERENLKVDEVGIESSFASHHAAWARAEDGVAALLANALRPRRTLDVQTETNKD